jgi:hypothetical protein
MSPAVIAAKATPNASWSASTVRAARVRSSPFTFDQIISIGLRSGEYGGRYNTLAPADSICRRMSGRLWAVRLSITTTSPGRSVGMSTRST